MQPASSGTVDAFIFPAKAEKQLGLGFSGYIAVPQEGLYTFYLQSDAESRLYIGGWGMAASKSPRIDDGQWHHVAFVWDQTRGKRTMHLFPDGATASTGNGPESASTDKFSLGVCNHMQGQSFIGTFDEIRIYQRRLEAEEIKLLATKVIRDSNPKPSTA